MFRYLFSFLFLFSFSHADWDHLFPENEDPTVVHHVNVISGQLNLSFIDTVIQGPVSLPITRTYSSSGALERLSRQDLFFRALQHHLAIQGGWSFFPELHLLIESEYSRKTLKAYLEATEYVYAHKQEDHVYFLTPSHDRAQHSRAISARNNILNYRLKVDTQKGRAVLYLPSGGSRIYEGPKVKRGTQYPLHYKLKQERLPSKHIIDYSYDKKGALKRVALKNPDGSKTYSWADVTFFQKKGLFPIRFKTSDNHRFLYQAIELHERHYISSLESTSHPKEICFYNQARKGVGAAVSSLNIADHTECFASYVEPQNKEEERKWLEKPHKKSFSADRVDFIQEPVGLNGALETVATFFYEEGKTDVRDAHNYLTRYRYNKEKLGAIEYFDEHEALYSLQKFFWKDLHLKGKAMLDASGKAVFAKTFTCDAAGNVKEEVLWGNLTGEANERFEIKEDGTLQGAESYFKHYDYLAHYNVPILEEEENGPTYRYVYKPGTDILEAKYTCEGTHILKREFFIYDEDLLLTTEILDDGSSDNLHNLNDVIERHIKRYENNASGLPYIISTYYLEKEKEVLLGKTKLTYSSHNKVELEEFFDANGNYRYNTKTEYNDLGCPILKRDPFGHENRYDYNELGKLKKAREVGSSPIIYGYDRGGRKISEEMHARIKKTSYDTKCNVIAEIDEMGNTTRSFYDSFGRCQKIELPILLDEEEVPYTPTIHYEHDIQGVRHEVAHILVVAKQQPQILLCESTGRCV